MKSTMCELARPQRRLGYCDPVPEVWLRREQRKKVFLPVKSRTGVRQFSSSPPTTTRGECILVWTQIAAASPVHVTLHGARHLRPSAVCCLLTTTRAYPARVRGRPAPRPCSCAAPSCGQSGLVLWGPGSSYAPQSRRSSPLLGRSPLPLLNFFQWAQHFTSSQRL